MDWARSLSFQPLRFVPVQSPYARLTCAVPYLATSASSASVIDGCALSASISTASRATFPLSPAMNPKDICETSPRDSGLHADAEAVLELIERRQPPLVEGRLPQLGQRLPRRVLVAAQAPCRLHDGLPLLPGPEQFLVHRCLPHDHRFHDRPRRGTDGTAARPRPGGPSGSLLDQGGR